MSIVIKKISDEKILIKRYWSNGQLKFEANLNEMPDELLDKANGTEITPENYETKGGSKDGIVSRWFENGQIQREVSYKDGKFDGKWAEWFENGQISSEEHYKDDKEDGEWAAWDENGQIRSEKHYKAQPDHEHGFRDGKFTIWDENGQITLEENYEDNVKV